MPALDPAATRTELLSLEIDSHKIPTNDYFRILKSGCLIALS